MLDGVAVSAGDEISASDISSGKLTFVPFADDSGSDEYAGDTRNDGTTVVSGGVGDQEESYAQFDFSVSDGTAWSDTSATMTIDVNAVADAPDLSVGMVTYDDVTIDVNNVTATDQGFHITAYAPDGTQGIIATHTSTPEGFGVTYTNDNASGADAEIGYDSDSGQAEKLVVDFDNTVSSVDVSFAWKANSSEDNTTEDALVIFYRNGVEVGRTTDVGGSDGVDPVVTLDPGNGESFDRVEFTVPNQYDDYLIHSISFKRADEQSDSVMLSEGESISLDISSALTDTDGSESLSLRIDDVPVGAVISDGTNSFTATDTTTSVDITGWDLDKLTMTAPDISSMREDYILNVVATSTEYSNGDSASTSVPLQVTVVDNTPIVHDADVRVSEEGLDNGIADNDGANAGDDTTDNTIISGSMDFSDAKGDNLSVTLDSSSIHLTSGGEDVVWSGGDTNADGSSTLIGSANGEDVIRIDVAANGDYTVELLGAVDHPENSVEDVLNLNVGVSVTNGEETSNATLTVGIEDDMAMAGDITHNIEIPEQNTNLMFTIDTSGSMGWGVDDGNGGTIERMELVLRSVKDVINSYDDIGNVRVQITTFNYNGDSTHQTHWLTASEALDFIGDGSSGSRDPSLNPGGGTNYDEGLAEAKIGWDVDGKIPESVGNVANVMYFLSDGQPQTAGGSENSKGITNGADSDPATNEIKEWTDFVVANNINVFAVGVGSGLSDSDRQYLDPIAYDGVNDIDTQGVLVTTDSELSSTLLSTVQAPLSGNVLTGSLQADGFGADGGYFSDITIDGTTYTYNRENDTISDGTNTINGSQLSIDTAQGGHLELNFVSGEYTYQPDVHLAEGETKVESFDFTAMDNDGDQSTGTVTMNVTRAQHQVSDVAADANEVYESAMSIGTDPDDTREVVTGNLFDNDTVANGAQLNVTIAGGTTDTSVAGQITVTTKEGNTLVVNTETGDYTYTLNNPLSHTEKIATGNTINLANDTFNGNDKDGWILSKDLNNSNDRLRIDGGGDTATKTFHLGSDYAGETVTISFDAKANKNWDGGSDTLLVEIQNQQQYNDSFRKNQGRSYSFDAVADENGDITVKLTADNNSNKEDMYIDNFKIDGPEFTHTQTDSLVDSFTYTLTDLDGSTHSANLNITVHDDTPIVSDSTSVSISLPETTTTNLLLTLDVSGSMSQDVNGQTRFEIAKSALIDTINGYENQGSVNVNLTLFNTGAVNLGWQNATDAIAYLNLLTMDSNGYVYYDNNTIPGLEDGWTNYEAAIAVTDDGYGSAPSSDRTVAYFISDGEPTKEYDDDTANPSDTTDSYTQDSIDNSYVDNSYLNAWSNFINNNHISLEVIGIGNNLDKTYLDKIQVIDGKSSVIVTDETQLSDTMTSYIDSVNGTLIDADSDAGIIFGADGGHITEITYDGTTYTYDENHPIQKIDLSEGSMELNFETGEYVYTPNSNSSDQDITENFTVSVIDNDGDALNDQPLTMVIGVDSTYVYDGSSDIDAGAGFDTLIVSGDMNLDFSDTNMAQISNIEKIDLTDGTHEIDGLKLSDVIDITDGDNTLIITGDTADTLNSITNDLQMGNGASDWKFDGVTTDDSAGTNTYMYSTNDGSSTLTLVVDQNIDQSGLA